MTTKSTQRSHAVLQAKLTKLLAADSPGLTIDVDHSERWKRTAVTVRWAGFDDLLPEERFHRVFRIIPEDFYEKHLTGCVWFELGGNETLEDFLKLPRSEDVADKEPKVIRRLIRTGFFEALADELGEQPAATCRGDLSVARRILTAARFSISALRDALLVLMRNGAFCDCEVLFSAQLVQLRSGKP